MLFYSSKGGTGCSTVAANLAIALAKASSKKVALVDANLQFGDIDALLNLQGQHTIADAVRRIDELDSDLLNAITAPHPSGIRVLAAPGSPEVSETIVAEDVKNLLSILRREFGFVLLDTSSYLDDIVLAGMDLADRVLIVMTPEIPSIKGTKQFFEVAEALEYPLDQIDLILNKTLQRDGIRPDQIEGSMKHSILAQLEFDARSMRQATNQGLPLILSQPNHSLSLGFGELARQELAILDPQALEVAAQQEPAPKQERGKRRGFFARLRK